MLSLLELGKHLEDVFIRLLVPELVGECSKRVFDAIHSVRMQRFVNVNLMRNRLKPFRASE